ncbi:MAG: hypothetical protein R3C03_01070 [Pirellulaceae bacterium]
MARSGQTVVLSGLIQEETTKFQRGVPVLSNLPLLGPLFRFEGEENVRKELLIVLTPYLVDSEEDLEGVNSDEMDRMHWCVDDVREVYGNTALDPNPFYTSPKTYYPDLDPYGNTPEAMSAPEAPASAYPEAYPSSAPEAFDSTSTQPTGNTAERSADSNDALEVIARSRTTGKDTPVTIDRSIRKVENVESDDPVSGNVPKRSLAEGFRKYIPKRMLKSNDMKQESDVEVREPGINKNLPGFVRNPFAARGE